MLCMRCQERDSVLQVHQIVNDQTVVIHLCQECAKEQGLDTEVALEANPLSGFLAALERGTSGAEVAACPSCGATLQDFRQSSRLGCPECYSAFEAPLRDLLRRIHGATIHTGRRYIAGRESQSGYDTQDLIRELRVQLQLAIQGEQFERAAELRDRLRELE